MKQAIDNQMGLSISNKPSLSKIFVNCYKVLTSAPVIPITSTMPEDFSLASCLLLFFSYLAE